MKELVIASSIILALLLLAVFIRWRRYRKIIEIQDDVCYELLIDAKERNDFMYAMKLFSEEEYQKNKDKLLNYVDRLTEAEKMKKFMRKKKGETDDKHQ